MTASSSVNVMNQPISTSLTSSDILTRLPENQKEKAYKIANSIDLAILYAAKAKKDAQDASNADALAKYQAEKARAAKAGSNGPDQVKGS